MRRKSKGNQNLIPFNLKIEAIVPRLGRGVRRSKKIEAVMTKEDNRVLRDYPLPQASSISSSIIGPAI